MTRKCRCDDVFIISNVDLLKQLVVSVLDKIKISRFGSEIPLIFIESNQADLSNYPLSSRHPIKQKFFANDDWFPRYTRLENFSSKLLSLNPLPLLWASHSIRLPVPPKVKSCKLDVTTTLCVSIPWRNNGMRPSFRSPRRRINNSH